LLTKLYTQTDETKYMIIHTRLAVDKRVVTFMLLACLGHTYFCSVSQITFDLI